MKKLLMMVIVSFGLAASACGNDNPPPAGSPDGGVQEPQCFMNPTTHVEIINACATWASEKKTPVLPLLNADGTLPPLP